MALPSWLVFHRPLAESWGVIGRTGMTLKWCWRKDRRLLKDWYSQFCLGLELFHRHSRFTEMERKAPCVAWPDSLQQLLPACGHRALFPPAAQKTAVNADYIYELQSEPKSGEQWRRIFLLQYRQHVYSTRCLHGRVTVNTFTLLFLTLSARKTKTQSASRRIMLPKWQHIWTADSDDRALFAHCARDQGFPDLGSFLEARIWYFGPSIHYYWEASLEQFFPVVGQL